MKIKSIVFIFVIFGFIGLSYVSAADSCNNSSDCTDDNANTCINNYCVDTNLGEVCINNGGTVSREAGDCNCSLVQSSKAVACDAVSGACTSIGGVRKDDLCYTTDTSTISCPIDQIYDKNIDGSWTKDCCPGLVVASQENPGKMACIINNEGDLGIKMNSDCLINGQCSYNIYKTLGIRKSDQDPSVGSFVQDIVLAVTMFIGTVVAIVLVTSGILYILSSIRGSSSQADMAKKGIINSLIGLILVVSSYALVRLIQFLATAGGG